jgi:lactobin A/cerein 7B family class IIb bacteriocin
MEYLNSEELKNINGGISFGILSLIGAAITFIIGLLDGITRPLRCR